MPFRSIFVFDHGSPWARDWSQLDFVDHRPGIGEFTRLDMPDPRSMPHRYHGSRNTLIVRREDVSTLCHACANGLEVVCPDAIVVRAGVALRSRDESFRLMPEVALDGKIRAGDGIGVIVALLQLAAKLAADRLV